jgi:hypothetical protein
MNEGLRRCTHQARGNAITWAISAPLVKFGDADGGDEVRLVTEILFVPFRSSDNKGLRLRPPSIILRRFVRAFALGELNGNGSAVPKMLLIARDFLPATGDIERGNHQHLALALYVAQAFNKSCASADGRDEIRIDEEHLRVDGRSWKIAAKE